MPGGAGARVKVGRGVGAGARIGVCVARRVGVGHGVGAVCGLGVACPVRIGIGLKDGAGIRESNLDANKPAPPAAACGGGTWAGGVPPSTATNMREAIPTGATTAPIKPGPVQPPHRCLRTPTWAEPCSALSEWDTACHLARPEVRVVDVRRTCVSPGASTRLR